MQPDTTNVHPGDLARWDGTEVYLPIPQVGASQHLAILRDDKSVRRPNPIMFVEREQLPYTVLAPAFFPEGKFYIRTPLPPPLDRVLVPPVSKEELRLEPVCDSRGQHLGTIMRLPGVLVWLNRILANRAEGIPDISEAGEGERSYDYRRAILAAAMECGHALARILRNGILRTREHPGFMAHLAASPSGPDGRPVLAEDEVGISQGFADIVFAWNRDRLPDHIQTPKQLDGFPCFAIRFPVANRHGVQESYLRILPGKGRYIAWHPWKVKQWLLGDCDGDQAFVLLRTKDLADGKVKQKLTLPLLVADKPEVAKGKLTIDTLFDPPAEAVRDYSTVDRRLAAVAACDARSDVGIYCMTFMWIVPRVLASTGQMGYREAHLAGADAYAWFIENSMDARKGEGHSAFAGEEFDRHAFMNALAFGGEIDFAGLAKIGVPSSTVDLLKAAYIVSGGNFRSVLQRQIVFSSLVLGRRTFEQSVQRMMLALRRVGVAPEEVYDFVVKELFGLHGPTLYPEGWR